MNRLETKKKTRKLYLKKHTQSLLLAISIFILWTKSTYYLHILLISKELLLELQMRYTEANYKILTKSPNISNQWRVQINLRCLLRELVISVPKIWSELCNLKIYLLSHWRVDVFFLIEPSILKRKCCEQFHLICSTQCKIQV